jgi:hypothetical protein
MDSGAAAKTVLIMGSAGAVSHCAKQFVFGLCAPDHGKSGVMEAAKTHVCLF